MASTVRKVFRYGLLFGFSGVSIFLERSEIYRKIQLTIWRSRVPQDYVKPHIVILGSGWGAVGVMQRIMSIFYNVTLISPKNYFLFTPLLASASVGTISASDLIESVRKILRRCQGKYIAARATRIDTDQHLVYCSSDDGDTFTVKYDILVIAVGAQVNTFGIKGVKEHAHFLKDIGDAKSIRHEIIRNIEMAALPSTSLAEKARLLQFVIVGGGPTGVEFAAEMYDFISQDLRRYLCKELADLMNITVIQGADHILNTYDLKISDYAENLFQREGIQVITNAKVKELREGELVYEEKLTQTVHRRPFGLCLWSTGIQMIPFIADFKNDIPVQAHEKAIIVDEYLRVKGIKDNSVFAIGDCATIELPHLADLLLQKVYERADTDGKRIQVRRLKELSVEIEKEKPQLRVHFEYFRKFLSMSKEADRWFISIEKIQSMLRDIDMKLKSLPATAQVASQEGKYLGTVLNNVVKTQIKSQTYLSHQMALEIQRPFIYHHRGMTAYVGTDHAVIDFGKIWFGDRFLGLWLWRSIYLNEQVAFHTRFAVALGWFKRYLFERDLTSP